MSAVAMVVGASDNLQLGFPSAYESNYVAKQKPLRAYPSAPEPRAELMIGDDLQAQWHQQKKQDADYMSGAKVQSTINSNARANVSAHGMYKMPKPVLSQRVFANPSNEALSIYSARQDQKGPFRYIDDMVGTSPSQMTGGVLRSAAGQLYGKQQLLKRVPELNAIDDAKVQFLLQQQLIPGLPQQTMPFAESLKLASEIGQPIERDIGLQRVVDLLMGADVLDSSESGFRSADKIFQETRSVIGSIIAMGATATVSELSDVLGMIQRIKQLISASLETDVDDPFMNEFANKQAQATYITLQDIYSKLNDYLVRMVEGANLQPKERITLARSMVKNLNFGKALNVAVGRTKEALALAERSGTIASRQDAMNTASRGHFNHPTYRREDTEHGSFPPSTNDTDFGDTERSAFGWRSGDYFPTQGRSVGYFGAEEGTVDYGSSIDDFQSGSMSEASLPGRSSLRSMSEVSLPGRSSLRSFASESSLPGRSSLRSMPQPGLVPSNAPVRAFFDPSTQGFNIESLSTGSDVTESTRVMKKDIPIGNEALSRAREGRSSRNVASLLRGEEEEEEPLSPTRGPRTPVRRMGRSEPSALGVPEEAYLEASELPNDVEGLKRLSESLRARGYNNVPVVYGTNASTEDGKRAYIRNVKRNILRAIQPS